MTNDTRDRIANVGAGMVPTYHATESVEEAKAVVEQCKTSTERLRAMLDERGVKWKRKRGRKHDGTEWYDQFGVYAEAVQEYSWDGFEYPEGKLLVRRGMDYLTPEQAIAATLGNGEYERKMDALLCRLTNGKFSKTRAYDLDFMESLVREEFETDSASLEAETCFPALSSERDGLPYLDPWFVCSECGCQLTESRLGRIWQNYCPNCGRRIRIRMVDGE